eukprot:scaffold12982_cov129-Cylindrotheca_fusiformis.AAC.1
MYVTQDFTGFQLHQRDDLAMTTQRFLYDNNMIFFGGLTIFSFSCQVSIVLSTPVMLSEWVRRDEVMCDHQHNNMVGNSHVWCAVDSIRDPFGGNEN